MFPALRLKLSLEWMLKYICMTRMNLGKEWAREHSLRRSSGKTFFSGYNAKEQEQCKRSEMVFFGGSHGWIWIPDSIKSWTFKVLRSTIKLKTPAGNMPVQVVTSRGLMALLVELCVSPEGHNWGVHRGFKLFFFFHFYFLFFKLRRLPV